MPYSAETLPSLIVRNMLNTQWNTQGGSIPTPTFVDVGGVSQPIRVDLNRGDYVLVRGDTPTEEETPIGSWQYGNRLTRVLLELYTQSGRQRLYDLLQEVRRVVHNQMHSLANYQRIRYNSFNELTNEQENIWAGRVILTLENNAVLLEV